MFPLQVLAAFTLFHVTIKQLCEVCVLQMDILRLRNVKQFAQDHIANLWHCQAFNLRLLHSWAELFH